MNKNPRGAVRKICSKCGTNVIDKDRCPVCGNVLHERVVLFSEGSPNEFDEIESLAHRDQIVKMTALTFVLAAVGVLVSLLFFFEDIHIHIEPKPVMVDFNCVISELFFLHYLLFFQFAKIQQKLDTEKYIL